MKKLITSLVAIIVLASAQSDARNFDMFTLDNKVCYDRKTEPYSFVVDTHLHFQPFGGPAIPFDKMLNHLQRQDVYFANVYGIGQKLPAKSPCFYY